MWLTLAAASEPDLATALAAAAETDDLSALSARWDDIPVAAVEASDPLRLLAGRREIAAGNDVAALVWLAPVKPTSVFGLRARLLVAEIHLRAGRSRDAVRAFRSVASADTTTWPHRDWSLELQDRAILGIVDVYRVVDRPDDALEYLTLIGPDSPYAPEGLAARARAVLGQGQPLWALGLLADLRHPPRRWTAEAEVVEVLGLLDACPTPDPGRRRLEAVLASWAPIADAARVMLPLADPAPALPPNLVALALRDHERRARVERGSTSGADERARQDGAAALTEGLRVELAALDRSLAEARAIRDALAVSPAAVVVDRHAPRARRAKLPASLVPDRGEAWADEVGSLIADPAVVCR